MKRVLTRLLLHMICVYQTGKDSRLSRHTIEMAKKDIAEIPEDLDLVSVQLIIFLTDAKR